MIARTLARASHLLTASRVIERLRDPREPVERFVERARGLGPKLGPVLVPQRLAGRPGKEPEVPFNGGTCEEIFQSRRDGPWLFAHRRRHSFGAEARQQGGDQNR